MNFIQSNIRSVSKKFIDWLNDTFYRVDQSSNSQTITGSITNTGNIISLGYILGMKIGACAFIDRPEDTSIKKAGVYQPILGEFINEPLLNFITTITTDLKWPGIMYVGPDVMWFLIDWHASFTNNHPNSSTTFAIAVNLEIIPSSCMSSFVVRRDLPQNASGTAVVRIWPGDIITLVLTSETLQTITIINYITTISEFFD